MLQGSKIKLRTIEEHDAEILSYWRNDPKSFDAFFSYESISNEKQKEWIRKVTNDKTQCNWMIIVNEGEDYLFVVGTLALQDIDLRHGKAEYVRLIIDDTHRGKGYAYEAEELMLEYAFNYLRLNKVYCQTYIDNEAVINLHLKTGFKKIGVHKKHVYRNGVFIDVQLMEILKEEYTEEEC